MKSLMNRDEDDDFFSIEKQELHVLPIEDSIDLHTFRPSEATEVLEEYFQACREKNLLDVRVIHGKGRGHLRAKVRAFLEKNPQVDSFVQAPPERGGWGAVMVRLKPWRQEAT